MSAVATAGLAASAAGLRPIACFYEPESDRLLPKDKFAAGFASDHPKFAAKHFARHSDAQGLALIMGECRAGNVFALDLDRRKGVNGVAECARLLRDWDLQRLPPGPRAATANDGSWHILLRAPAGVKIRNMSGDRALRPGLDVKGHNGLLTIAPSERRAGGYRWLDGCDLSIPIPMAPAQLIEAVRERERPQQIAPQTVRRPARSNDASPDEVRERLRCESYVQKALACELYDLEHCGKGGRNHALNKAAATLARFVAGEPDLVNEEYWTNRIYAAARANGLAKDDGPHAVRATFDSGFAYGRTQPRTVPPPRNEQRAPDQGARCRTTQTRSENTHRSEAPDAGAR